MKARFFIYFCSVVSQAVRLPQWFAHQTNVSKDKQKRRNPKQRTRNVPYTKNDFIFSSIYRYVSIKSFCKSGLLYVYFNTNQTVFHEIIVLKNHSFLHFLAIAWTELLWQNTRISVQILCDCGGRAGGYLAGVESKEGEGEIFAKFGIDAENRGNFSPPLSHC